MICIHPLRVPSTSTNRTHSKEFHKGYNMSSLSFVTQQRYHEVRQRKEEVTWCFIEMIYGNQDSLLVAYWKI
ncbi:hypothetical protein C0J52_14757 [Blattella germanica]|nr:hypothetical protein C0J52_14757 [Blattella germanica]